MGGEIQVQSELGIGTTFAFTTARFAAGREILSADPIDLTIDAESKIKARFGGRKVLLAEDEPINQEVTMGLLEEAGLVPVLAVDGVDAVEQVRYNDFVLVLMDMQMPRMVASRRRR